MRCSTISTILLATGWLLLLPPIVSKDTIDNKRPLREWDHDSSYDTAQECENFRARMSERYEKQGKQLHQDRFLFSRCIPSDIYPSLIK